MHVYGLSLYTIIVVHNATQNVSDNVLSYPPDNHRRLDVAFWRGRDILTTDAEIYTTINN